MYRRVLTFQTSKNEKGQIDWAKFFDSNSVYLLLYTLQIVEAVMEEGEGEGLEKVALVENEVNKKIPVAPPLPGPIPPSDMQTPETPVKDKQEPVEIKEPEV
jgi:hypothetical protein